MKATYVILFIFYLLSQIYAGEDPFPYEYSLLLQNAEIPKVCQLKDGNVLALASVEGKQESKVTKFKSDGKPIYENNILSTGYTPSAQVAESKDETRTDSEYYLFHHNNQYITGQDSHEYVSKFKDGVTIPNNKEVKNAIYKTTSIVSLKNGQILLVGANKISTDMARTHIDLSLYNPVSNTFEHNGVTFEAYDNLVSCYEQKDNDIYCAYVSTWNEFVNKLALKHITVQGGVINIVEELEVIKNFYTVFNFVKAVRFNVKEAVILFQTGNNKKTTELLGNEGKDLYFYKYSTYEKSVLRYEYLFNGCTYREDAENANADIVVLSEKRIFAVCEFSNSLKLFSIVDGDKPIGRFKINDFSMNSAKNPVFAIFDKTLSLFYTGKKSDTTDQVIYSFLDYPNCIDIKNETLLPIRYDKFKNVSFFNFTYMGNPYLSKKGNVEIKVRFKELPITLYDKNRNRIDINKDYDSNTFFYLYSESQEGKYNLEFTATRQDIYDGLIIGNTCKLTINTPKCLPQCNSCNQTGNDAIHYCNGCYNESFYIRNEIEYFGEEFDKLHNCYPCDQSCFSCEGPLILTDTKKTTNCKRCYYENGYFPYENDESLCISELTQDYWEELLDYGIYLDKPDFFDNKTWIWRNCHRNCRKCRKKGDDGNNQCDFCRNNYYFYWDQIEGNGIPGSCNNNCTKNGFYTKKTDDKNREKCFPCLDHCQECPNNKTCDLCFEDYFLTLNKTMCVEDCGYCLAEDKIERKCVDCSKNNSFTLNKTCVNTLYVQNKSHHIIDTKCNLLIGCKDGCYKCDPWYSDKCTECNSSYYKEDFFGMQEPNTFHCFNKTVCQGLDDYPHDKEVRVGGVATKISGKDICMNCKLRYNNYRQPEHNFTCGPLKKRTYVDIPEYNKLSDCYFRCNSCDTWGNSFKMNCTSCRDKNNYEHFLYHAGYGNCYRKTHKCGIYPYYHDYEIAEAMGYDEDDCGEKCDVCLYNFSCTEHFPYFRFETHECVEYCPITEVLTNTCNMNNTAALIILLRNPFGLRNPYDFLSSTVTIQQFLASSLFQYIAQAYNIDVSLLSQDLNNYIGNGKIYNLPQSQVISGNNITLELTTFKLELEKLIEILNGKEKEKEKESSGNTDVGSSILNLTECEALLKKKYGLPDEEDLMIIKGDLLKQLTEDYYGNAVDYQIFSTSLGAFLPLSDCQEAGTTISVTNPFNYQNLLTQYQSKTGAVTVNGYNPFDVNSPFYNDICTAFTNENGNDVLLDDRRKDYFDENVNLCESGCKFIGYNTSTNMYTCICNIKPIPGADAGEYTGDYVTNEMPKGFRDMISKRSNIEVFKCASQVFSSKGQKKNFGSYILLVAFASLIGVIVFHYVKEGAIMHATFKKLGEIPKSNIKANPPKPTGTEEEKKQKSKDHANKNDNKPKENESKNKTEKIRGHARIDSGQIKDNSGRNAKTTKRILPKEKPAEISNAEQDFKLTEDQLNNASFEKAIKNNDTRTWNRYYWTLLKAKQLFIFTFYTSGDYILRSTKIALFILFISFYLAFTALFFNDDIMRAIYIYKGNTDAAVHIPNIILSTLCCLVASLIIRFVSLNERDISMITQLGLPQERKRLAEKIEKITKIKLIILYAISGALILFFWYYVSAFCAIFKNSQGHYFTNVLVSFIICNIWPCAISLIPAFLRTKALEKKNETMYKISQIVAYF